MRRRSRLPGALGPLLLAVVLLAAGCGPVSPTIIGDPHAQLFAVGAESQYADVIAQVGGRYVKVAAIMSNPATDPHAFEASPGVANAVATARLVVQNGLGYDGFMNRIESAAPSATRDVIVVQKLLGIPDSESNPHLWYRPGTMTAVASAVAAGLASREPGHAAYFRANAAAFGRSLAPWYRALAQLRERHPGAPVATTEPVGDFMIQAAGARNLTPFALQADIMNGIDPAPQNVTIERALLSRRRVKVLLYNQQVTDTLTRTLLADATASRVPVVGLYETMPTGYHYQSWMLAEAQALQRALAQGTSTGTL